ncbi:glycoside hydrolase family 3 N-terminal domain-containing protein [Amycolatopsis sp. H20-H5]|uniref:glycoside hydrolase family 3 N-terminal domain-containing protein n=1 Tax=Amycolatopsis sp. H20-H5 TaxID=3046309 RepID=UPI002DBDA304|nr:glycoside hydrolase family 3 N-terminal domain-containing protein [Amycolatopsis sp. H20-H5]MEC3977340.1 glycoside hydrolase family 3 N-terminal domain-containing protein [Amycolatopsis sp. H20-H5]
MIRVTRRRTLKALVVAVVLGSTVAAVGAAAEPRSLTPQQLAGQRVIYSYPGLTPPETLLQRIRTGQAAGVIFFGENISGTAQIASVVTQLRDAAAQSPVKLPLLLMTDQEGGQVRRLPDEPVLSEKQVGQAADPESAAKAAGTGAGNNLASAGMNVNLAPVLDVYRQAGNFIDQYGRSYSMDSRTVGVLGRDFVTAQQATGVAATAKHFPGLGAAPAGSNTDTGPLTLNVSLSDLRTKDEAPYSGAVGAGVKLVMLSWAVYPALDGNRPAGLSSTVIQQELRHGNNFQGVTITDALEAGALRNYGSTGNRAVLAAGAGMDLILASARDVAQGDDVVSGLAAALGNGTLPQAAFTASADRVSALRSSLH